MCIAIYIPEFKELSKDILKICNDANPDGMGFAFFNDKNELVLNKEVDEKKILRKIDMFPIIRKHFIHKPFLLHFRIATHGKISNRCCHPFRVNETTVFCHNGILDNDFGATRDGDTSDTMMFNKNILQRLSKKELNGLVSGKNDLIKELLEGYIGDRNKMIIMNSKNNVVILNERKGIWDKGCWFSNDSYKEKKVFTINYGSYWQGNFWDNDKGCWSSYEDDAWWKGQNKK